MIRYTTVEKEGVAEQTIQRSRFIAHVAPAATREAAEAFIKRIREEYKDATHNVPAFVIGEKKQLQWASDDGEPQGTSGAPMAQMLVSEDLTNVVVVVTRYWGGIKLGTGGLVRAYTGTAKLGIAEAGIHVVKDVRTVRVTLAYNILGKLKNLEEDMPFSIKDTEFGEQVSVRLEYEPEQSEAVMGMLADLTGGKATIDEQIDSIC